MASSLDDLLSQYETLTGSAPPLPEAGPMHYLKRGALQGISALANMPLNAAKLAVAGGGVALHQFTGNTGYLPNVGGANPIAEFLMRGYHLDEPVRPAPYLGELGAAALEGAGAAVGQGPIGLLRQAPIQIAKQIAAQEAKAAGVGGLAGGGSYIGNEASGGDPIAALGGGILAGVVAPSSFLRYGGMTVGAMRAAAKTAAEAKANLAQIQGAIGSKLEPAFGDYVGSQLKAAAAGTPNAAENLTEGMRLRSQIPGFNPSVPEMANSPGLIDMQRKFALTSPQALNEEVSRMQANSQAIRDYYRNVVPEAQQPSSVRSALNENLAAERKTSAAAEKAVGESIPSADQMNLGGQLISLAKSEKVAAKAPISLAYDEAFRQSGEATTSGAKIVAKAEDILGEPISQIKPENTPQTVSAIKRIAGGKTELNLQDLHDIRKAIGQDMASAVRSANPVAATRMRNLAQLLPEVDAAISELPGGQAYQAARAKYATEYAPRFKEGTPGQVFRDKATGEERILPDRFMSEFFKPDASAGITRADQFGKLFGDNAQAKDLAKAGILDVYKRNVVDPTTGALDIGAHNRFVANYGRTLESFKSKGVNALDDINSVGKQARAVAAANDRIVDVTKQLKFNTTDDLVDAALRDRKIMGNVSMRLTPETRQTFGSTLLDRAMQTGTGEGMQKFLTDNAATLKIVVPQRQLSAMQDISNALSIAERAPLRGNLAAGGADALKNATGISTATVFAQIRAVTGQRSSVEWAAINLAMPALNKMTQTNFASVMKQALHSPESAETLRNYLLAQSPQQANTWAARFFDSAKRTGQALWDLKGPIGRNFLGPQNYPGNFATSGTAIRSQLDNQQGQQ